MGDRAQDVFKVIGIAALGLATFGVGSLLAGGALASAGIGGVLGGGIAFGGLSVSFATLGAIGAAALSAGFAPTLEDTGANLRGAAQFDASANFVFAFGRTLLPQSMIDSER